MAIDTYAHRVFHRTYLCMIPACDYYEPEFVAKFGMHTHPDPKIAKAMLYDRIHDHMSPAKAASWASDGIEIEFFHPKDSITVFRDVMGHLCDWRDHLESMPLFVNVPMQGLYEFHLFAKQMYRLAQSNGLSNRYKKTKLHKVAMSMRSSAFGGESDNPFKVRFNTDVWQDIIDYAELVGVDVKPYRDPDIEDINTISRQHELGSTNVNFANKYDRKRKLKDDERNTSSSMGTNNKRGFGKSGR